MNTATQLAIDHAAHLLVAGQLVAFPTETVYGLGADASSPAAVAAIFAAKGRPSNHPLIVHVADADHAHAWMARLDAATYSALDALVARFWPGPLTLIVPRAIGVPDAVTGGQNSVGLRCPAHPVARGLLLRFAELHNRALKGIAAPSANRFGHVSPTTAQHVHDEFGTSIYVIDGIDEGDCSIGIESTILDLTRVKSIGPVLLRPGSISAAMLAEVLGAEPLQVDIKATADATLVAPRASGTLAAHYAPQTPLFLVSAAELEAVSDADTAVWSYSLPPHPRNPHWLCAPRDAARYAHDLYATLRHLDTLRCQRILIERPPAEPAWAGVNDRLQRAAAAHA